MLKWKGATKPLSAYVKQMARQKGKLDAKRLRAFGAIYAGNE